LTFSSLLNNTGKCHYVDIPLKDNPFPSSNTNYRSISLLHVNIRSLNKLENFERLYEFLTLLSFHPDIVCVSETRLLGDPMINILLLPDYNFIHADSVANTGWVAVYISSKYEFEIDQDLEMKLNGCKELWMNLKSESLPKHITLESFIDTRM